VVSDLDDPGAQRSLAVPTSGMPTGASNPGTPITTTIGSGTGGLY